MSVVLDAKGTEGSNTTNVTSFNYTGLTIGASLSNGAAVFAVVWGNTVTLPSATWNSVSAPLILLTTITGVASIALFGITNPASGNKTLALSWTGAAPVWVAGASFSGVNQTGGTTTFANSAGNGSATANPTYTQAITTASGNYTVGNCLLGSGTATMLSCSPDTINVVYNDTTSEGALGVGSSMAIAPSTGTSNTWTGTNTTSDAGIIQGVEIVAAAGAAAPTWGFGQQSDRERPGLSARQWDEARPFFRPSPNPVPQIWLPTTGMEDRPPEPKKRPDDSSIEVPQFFQPSQHPVPQRWLPTTGEEDRPPALKRPPDEPYNFLFKTLPVAPPSRWLPLTGEEERPPNPNRILAPDQPFPFFVRSPSPVPSIWLPQWNGGDTGERPPPVWPKPANKFFSVQISTSTIAGMAWNNPAQDRERLPPIRRSPDEPFPWFVQSPNPVPVVWLPQWCDTGERPPPVWPKPANKFFSVQISASVPISGMAWYAPYADRERPPVAPPDASLTAFSFKTPTVVSTIAGIAWATQADVRIQPFQPDPYDTQTLPFVEPPLIPFYAAANADDFNPLKAVQLADITTSWAPQFIAPPVGISGIAWWRQTEVFLEPPPSYRDYHPAWDPQFVVQIVPPPQTAVYNTLLLSIPNGMFAIPGNPPS